MNDEQPIEIANIYPAPEMLRLESALTWSDYGRYIVLTTPRHCAGWAAYMAARSVSRP